MAPLSALHLACASLGLIALSAPAPAQAQPEPTLARIQREGVLRWGSDSSGGAPFVFNDPDKPSEVVGFEVELVERLAHGLGVTAVREQIDWAALPDSLKSGRIDLALNGLEVTEERARQILYTTPYFRFVQQLTVRSGDAGVYLKLSDLEGHTVSVLNGSTSVDVLEEAGWPADLIRQEDDSLKPFMAVKQHRADATMCESIIARYYADGDDELYVVPGTFGPGHYAGAVRREDVELKAALDRVIDEMKRSGELGEIYQRWGLWSADLAEIGIQPGQPQEQNPLARRNAGAGTGWDRDLALGLLLLKGAAWTLALTVLSMPIALAFGLVLALMSMSGNPWLRWPARIYIQIIRGTPLLVQIFVIFFALPLLGGALGLGGLLTWPAFVVGVLCLSANYAAYEAEIHRAGIEAVPKGQKQAALALGMSEKQAFVYVVLPQSFRIILPPVVNDVVSMLKDSCLVSVMGVGELLFVASSIGKATFLYGQMLLAAAAIYLVLSLAADRFGKHLELRLRQRGLMPVAVDEQSH